MVNIKLDWILTKIKYKNQHAQKMPTLMQMPDAYFKFWEGSISMEKLEKPAGSSFIVLLDQLTPSLTAKNCSKWQKCFFNAFWLTTSF